MEGAPALGIRQGTFSRTILDVPRDADGPLCVRDIADVIAKRSDRPLVKRELNPVVDRVRNVVPRLNDQLEGELRDRTTFWRVAGCVAWILCPYIKGVQSRSEWRSTKKPSVLPYSVLPQNEWNFWWTFNTLIFRSFRSNWPGYPCNTVAGVKARREEPPDRRPGAICQAVIARKPCISHIAECPAMRMMEILT
jgi:hypothetical protein